MTRTSSLIVLLLLSSISCRDALGPSGSNNEDATLLVTIGRSSDAEPTGATYELHVDGRAPISLMVDHTIELKLPPGTHVFYIEPAGGSKLVEPQRATIVLARGKTASLTFESACLCRVPEMAITPIVTGTNIPDSIRVSVGGEFPPFPSRHLNIPVNRPTIINMKNGLWGLLLTGPANCKVINRSSPTVWFTSNQLSVTFQVECS